ncbi:transcription factor RSL3-like [Solanum dulcamara]|uniref:transcription factor RSL3-like n=1 Tax=Solanum dulcamara TaxID=45834 RepID=UPI002485CC10|nr:transcription factor RSL3-like [Solanum dulcamara]
MEPVSEEEWSGMYSTDQEAYFMAQLLWQPNNIDNTTTSMYFSSYNGCSGSQFSLPSHESYYQSHVRSILTRNGSSITKEHSMVEGENTSSPSQVPTNYNLIEVDDFLNQDVSNDSMESGENIPKDVLQLGRDVELVRKLLQDKVLDSPPERSKQKRCRGLLEDVPKNKRSVKLKKTREIDGENKAALQRQNSISCCSEDESINVPKSRACRGSATDPQTLYARKRRERINQRLRILQSLVPNGTKVDISTMLEEAVQYINFLQLQIKLLSSDDLWMYAPIAYNGMDIGLNLKIGTPKS